MKGELTCNLPILTRSFFAKKQILHGKRGMLLFVSNGCCRLNYIPMHFSTYYINYSYSTRTFILIQREHTLHVSYTITSPYVLAMDISWTKLKVLPIACTLPILSQMTNFLISLGFMTKFYVSTLFQAPTYK